MMKPELLIIDLFCGIGGTTTGFARARINGKRIAKVIAAINHDPIHIKSHWLQHKSVKHFEEDIRTLNLTDLVNLVNKYRRKFPQALIGVWASVECPEFSKAKAGLPKNIGSRTLAKSLHMKYNAALVTDTHDGYFDGDSYMQLIKPDILWIENVTEFRSWGPCDNAGKPISRKNGEHFMKWRKDICALGYTDSWRELNSADFGCYTSRNRLFGVFVKEGIPITWPEPTHYNPKKFKSINGSLFPHDLKPYKAVRDVLDLHIKGTSIFLNPRLKSEKTKERLYEGLIKHVGGGKKEFLSKYFSGNPESKNFSVDGPAHTITTIDHHSIVQALPIENSDFLIQYNGKPGTSEFPTNAPCRTLRCKDRVAFIQVNHSQGKQESSVKDPLGSLTTVTKENIITCRHFVQREFSSGDNSKSINDVNGSILSIPKENLIECRFLFDHQFGNKGYSVECPSPTIIARQDKKPLGIVTTEKGDYFAIIIYPGDSPFTVKIKEFMAMHGIIDMYMRMLNVDELLRIQDFSVGRIKYKTQGSSTKIKEGIGNAVVPKITKVMAEAQVKKLIEFKLSKAA